KAQQRRRDAADFRIAACQHAGTVEPRPCPTDLIQKASRRAGTASLQQNRAENESRRAQCDKHSAANFDTAAQGCCWWFRHSLDLSTRALWGGGDLLRLDVKRRAAANRHFEH